MSPDTILVLLIVAVVGLPIIAYELLILIRKIKSRERESGNTDIDEQAYNTIQSTDSISRIMKDRGYDTRSVDSIIADAKNAYKNRNYSKAVTSSLEAKRLLERLQIDSPKKEVEISSPKIDSEIEKIAEIKVEPKTEEYKSPAYQLQKKLPENYLAAKFSIDVTEKELDHCKDPKIVESSKKFLDLSKKSFDEKNYTDALRFSVKAEKILKREEIAETVIREKSEELRCSQCGSIVQENDTYCWNCGAKIILAYFCPNCNREVKPTDKFCRYCGIKLEQ